MEQKRTGGSAPLRLRLSALGRFLTIGRSALPGQKRTFARGHVNRIVAEVQVLSASRRGQNWAL